jgi:CheY-like chemotaxis protein
MIITQAEIHNASVLVVDDQPANVTLLVEMLRAEGYARVEATMDPTEVFALHRRSSYDLILLDLQMPEMDGFQVMEGLKANQADGILPVLVITAHCRPARGISSASRST